jgi:hypothetical protein
VRRFRFLAVAGDRDLRMNMRRAVLLLLSCAACAPRTTTTTVSSMVTSVAVTSSGPGGLAAFVAAVPPFEEGGTCGTMNEAGRQVVTLRFAGPGETVRSLALTMDARGEVVNYSDARGDLKVDGTGPRTVVSVNLELGVAMALNERGDAPGVTTGGAAKAMELENLGNPRRMSELVKRRCMGARS